MQSGSDSMLAAMKRNHTAADYLARIHKLKAARPDILISSDFIIGFPNETDDDFMATMNLIAEVDFDHSFSFIFSKRPGTPAAELPDSVSEETKKARLVILKDHIKKNTLRKTRDMIGTTQRVLVEKISDRQEGYVVGSAENLRLVFFPADASLVGRFVDVVITEEANVNAVRAGAPIWVEDVI